MKTVMLILLSTTTALAFQKMSLETERRAEIEDQLGYQDWQTSVEGVVSGMYLTHTSLGLPEGLNNTAVYSIEQGLENPYGTVQKTFMDNTGAFLKITMRVTPSFQDGTEALLGRYVASAEALPLAVEPGKHLGMDFGDVAFARKDEVTGAVNQLHFLRGNVLISIDSQGELMGYVGQVAELIDRALRDKPAAAELSALDDYPFINKITLDATTLSQGETTAAVVDGESRVEAPPQLLWDLSHGGVADDLCGGFLYQATEAGNAWLQVTLLNEHGLFEVAQTQILVK